jgi:hypothetical protein
MLNEVLTAIVSIVVPSWVAFPHLHIHQKGNHLRLEDQDHQATAGNNRAQRTPTRWDNVKIFGKVSFSHMITRPANGKSVGDFLGIIVNGRVDHGIGRVVPYSPADKQTSLPVPPTRC